MPGGGQDECVGVEVHTFDPWDFAGDTGKNAYYTSIDDMKQNLLYDVWEKLRIWQFASGITLYVGDAAAESNINNIYTEGFSRFCWGVCTF